MGCLIIAIGLALWSLALALVFIGTLTAVTGLIIGAPEVVMAILGRKPKRATE